MKFARRLSKELIFLKLPYRSKDKAICFLAKELCNHYKLSCEQEVIDSIVSREKVSCTGIGKGLAVPHGRVNTIDRMYVAFGRSTRGIEWGTKDKKPVHFIFLVVGPNKLAKEYLEMLSQISKLLLRHDARESIRHIKTPEELKKVIMSAGTRHHKR